MLRRITLFKIRRKINKILHPALGEVWMLHSVCKDDMPILNNEALEITASALEKIIQNKKNCGYEFITLDDLFEILNGAKKKKKFVCITLDDGYENNFSIAYPIFKRHNCPFAIAITIGLCDGSVKPWWCSNMTFLSFPQIKALAEEPLCTISAHSITHPRLNQLSYEQQKREIENSIIKLEALTNCKIKHFAYPHGDYDENTVQILNELDIRTSVKVNGGYVRHGQNRLLIPRIIPKPINK